MHAIQNRCTTSCTTLLKALIKAAITTALVGPMLIISSLVAAEADVVDVEIIALGDNKYRINTTVLHADAGWDHYANRWDVLAPDGTVLGSSIQANDSVHELGGKTMTVDVPQ